MHCADHFSSSGMSLGRKNVSVTKEPCYGFNSVRFDYVACMSESTFLSSVISIESIMHNSECRSPSIGDMFIKLKVYRKKK